MSFARQCSRSIRGAARRHLRSSRYPFRSRQRSFLEPSVSDRDRLLSKSLPLSGRKYAERRREVGRQRNDVFFERCAVTGLERRRFVPEPLALLRVQTPPDLRRDATRPTDSARRRGLRCRDYRPAVMPSSATARLFFRDPRRSGKSDKRMAAAVAYSGELRTAEGERRLDVESAASPDRERKSRHARVNFSDLGEIQIFVTGKRFFWQGKNLRTHGNSTLNACA